MRRRLLALSDGAVGERAALPRRHAGLDAEDTTEVALVVEAALDSDRGDRRRGVPQKILRARNSQAAHEGADRATVGAAKFARDARRVHVNRTTELVE